jgi:putative tryptophan/tyrosine transport system substrate-binding protein
MRRREFITLLGGAAAWPLAARAQQSERMRRIGVNMGWPEGDSEAQGRAVASREELQALGWTEGRNLLIEYRWGAINPDAVRIHTTELIDLTLDVVVTTNTIAVQMLRRSPQQPPTVFVGIADPVGSGVVTSLGRPGGNATGFTAYEPAITGKWLALLKEIAPSVERVALIFHPDTPFAARFLRSFESDALSVAVKPIAMSVRSAAEIEHAIEAFARDPNGGLLTVPETTATLHRELIIRLAAQHRLPAIYPYRYHATEGGLASYGIDVKDQWRRAASYVDRIFRGEKPADLPVQAPIKFELIINMKTAKALGLDMPASLLSRADEVIE